MVSLAGTSMEANAESNADDDELLPVVDKPSEDAVQAIQATSATENDSQMHIDEEGRPRFAPAKATVS